MLCGGPVTGQGEHALPNWLLRRYDRTGPGPFTYEVNGVAEATRDGTVRRLAHVTRSILRPVCGSADPSNCNGWMEHKFEAPAREYVEDLLTGRGRLESDAVAAVAGWTVKTLLLKSHPAVEHPEVRSAPRPWSPFPANWLPRLRATAQFPDDLSLWLAVHDPNTNGGRLARDLVIVLPHTVGQGGMGGVSQEANLGLGLDDGRVLELSLVYHPLCEVEHPFVEVGLATRLWPHPPALLDLTHHPVLDVVGDRQWKGLWKPSGGSYGVSTGQRLRLRGTAGTPDDPVPAFHPVISNEPGRPV